MRKVSPNVIEVFLSVMPQHLFWVVFVAYFSIFNKCETKEIQENNENPYMLTLSSKNRSKPPIIVYLEPRQNDGPIEDSPEDWSQSFRSNDPSPDILRDEDETEDDNEENFLRTSRSDERAYLLYHLLRTTIEEEDIDPETIQKLQPAKQFLRNAFIGRCRKLNKCVKQCPQKTKKYTCTIQCKQIFDDLDECDEPKENKCGVSKCGHTMPPSWLL